MPKHKLKVDPKWIRKMLNGEKEATIRYNLEEISNKSIYLENSKTKETFALAEVSNIVKCDVRNAIHIMKVMNVNYPRNDTHTLLEGLQNYYPGIKLEDTVSIVIFNDIWDAR